MKKLKFLLIVIPFLLQFLMPAMAFGASSTVWTKDTIAGLSTALKTGRMASNKTVIVSLLRPDKSNLLLETTTGKTGYLDYDIDGFHLKTAGQYRVALKFPSDDDFSNYSSFKVYPDELSESNSKVAINTTMLRANGKDQGTILVRLTDKYDNPIVNHQVYVLSSRTGDKITSTKDYTDQAGYVTFKITSAKSGASVLTIYDATAKKALSKRLSAVFMASGSSSPFATGGNDNYLDNIFLAQDAGVTPNNVAVDATALTKFKFTEITETAEKGDVLSFQVEALDTNDTVVQNYLGTVHFSVVGDNANDVTMPGDYEFVDTDMGKHKFTNVLTFQKPGSYKLSVNDLKDPTIAGDFTLTVSDAGISDEPSKITLTNPIAGTFNSNIQIVSGEALPGADVKIFDNDEQIGTVSADAKGSFSFTTPPMTDGKHSLYVSVVNDKGVIMGMSDKVAIEINTAKPTVESIILVPEKDIPMGAPVLITLKADANLSKVAVGIGQDMLELTPVEGKAGEYSGSFQAPSKSGSYDIDVYLTDSLNNEGSYKKEKTFTVSEVNAIPPSDVTGVKATPGAGKVTLTWAAAKDERGIHHYKIYYGSDPKTIQTNQIDTWDARTTWYVPKLKVDTTYYFTVFAVNKDGNQSRAGSKIISSNALAAGDPEGFPSALEDGEYDYEYENSAETGPGILVTMLISGLAGASAFVFRKRK